MEFSKEIIEVFDYIGEKFGVAIDWSNKNVIPYLQELCAKYINWEIATSIAWIVIGMLLLVAGIISIKYANKGYKEWEENGYSRWDSTKDIADALCIAGVLLVVMFIVILGINSFDIIKCITFPEMKIYEYIMKFVEV